MKKDENKRVEILSITYIYRFVSVIAEYYLVGEKNFLIANPFIDV